MSIYYLPAWAIDPGDLLDLQDDTIADPDGTSNVLMGDYAHVLNVARDPDTEEIVMVTDLGVFSFPPNHELQWCDRPHPEAAPRRWQVPARLLGEVEYKLKDRVS